MRGREGRRDSLKSRGEVRVATDILIAAETQESE